MAKKIEWTQEASDTFEIVIKYLEDNWSNKEIENFIVSTESVLNYISEYPLMFRETSKPNVREALITPHNLLIYKIRKEHIELITFWDTRKNPRKKIKIKK